MISSCKTIIISMVLTEGILRSKGDKDSIDDVVYLLSPQSGEVLVYEASLDPFDLAVVYSLGNSVVHGGILGGDELGDGANLYCSGASCSGQRISTDDQMDMVCTIHGRQ
jgi:hypothetical protein